MMLINLNLLVNPFTNRNLLPYYHKCLVLTTTATALLCISIFVQCCCVYPVDSYILFANRKDIRKIDQEKLNSSVIIIDQLEDATAIDFDYEDRLLFWTDLGLETIKRLDQNDSNVSDVVNTGIESPESLACDWITKKLYWADSEINHIDVSNYDGSHRKVLFWEDLDQVRAIVLMPSEQLMFWSDWGEKPKIERASMDGDPGTRQIIIHEDIYWPNGLTLDYKAKRLYFADAKLGYIASVNFDGGRLEKIALTVSKVFALTLSENLLLWTEMYEAQSARTSVVRANRAHKKGIHYYDRITRKEGMALSHERDLYPMGITAFTALRQPKSHNPCGANNGGCSHLCLLSATSRDQYSCACPTGIKLGPDGKRCRSSAEKFLLLARRSDIRHISLDTEDFTPTVLPIRNIKHVVTLDYDPIEAKLYWIDDELRNIKRAKLDGSQYETIVSTEIMTPDGLAVDWIARNIYWTDDAKDYIEVARLDGSSRKILIEKDFDKLRSIVVHPREGLMFWTDWGAAPKIERAALDGSERTVIINSSLHWPNGLAIDYELSHLYWCDAKMKLIEMARFDGSGRRIIIKNEHSHMYRLTLIDEWIYWTDWVSRTVKRAHKMTGNETKAVIENLPDLMGLKAVNTLTMAEPEHETNPCAQSNGGCSHLCFNRPRQNYVCGCPDGYELKREDGRTCTNTESYLLMLRDKDLMKISLKTDTLTQMVIEHMYRAVSFDVDYARNGQHWLYWTDGRAIARSLINGTKTEWIVQIGVGQIRELAFDWIAKNLYWIDDRYRRIEVSRWDGSYRRIILVPEWNRPHSLPYSLAVNPVDGYLFWSDHQLDKIFSSFLDGNKRKIIGELVGRAIALTVDYRDKRLYWISLDYSKIFSTLFNGDDKIGINLMVGVTPTRLAIYDDWVLFLDRDSKTLEQVHKRDHSNQTTLERDDSLGSVADILVYGSSHQSGWNLCANRNGECEQLCLYRPRNDSYCNCASHFVLDSNDSKRCMTPETFLLFSQETSIMRFLFHPERSKSDFQDVTLPILNLKNVRSLAYDPLDHYIYMIDGRTIKRAMMSGDNHHSGVEPVLHGGSHATQPVDLAIDPYARILFWTCNLTNSINVTRIISHHPPLSVGSVHHSPQDRPRLLAYHNRTNSLFWTNHLNSPRIERISFANMNKTTVIKDNLVEITAITVDQELDFLIWFDAGVNRIEYSSLDGLSRRMHALRLEKNMHPISMAAYAKYLFWIEKDRKTVEKVPLDLNHGKNKQTIFEKNQILTDIVAVMPMKKDSASLYCNKENGGCSDYCFIVHGADPPMRCECPQGLSLANNGGHKCVEKNCQPGEFQCRWKSKCIPGWSRCNGIHDCPDSSDETNCPECVPDQMACFTTVGSKCLDRQRFCDGTPDCSGGFDELCCGKHEFRCANHNCLSVSQLCDGKKDCLGGEDEKPANCYNISRSMGGGSVGAGSGTKRFNYSFFILIVFFVLGIAFLAYCQCIRYGGSEDKDTPATGVNVILMTERRNMAGTVLNNRNPHKKPGVAGNNNGNLLPPNLVAPKLDCGTLTTTTTTVSGLDTDRFVPEVHLNAKPPLLNTLASSLVCPVESLIERNVTGASSTSSSAANLYGGREAVNPPPSLATERSQCSSALFVAAAPRGPRQPPRNKNVFSGNKNRKKAGYKKSSKKSLLKNVHGPPPTPCSTDVYEDLEPCTIKYVFYDNSQEMEDEYDYRGPPPTPRNYLSEPSCPPSPVTERSYCNPYPPPPSPVQDYE